MSEKLCNVLIDDRKISMNGKGFQSRKSTMIKYS